MKRKNTTKFMNTFMGRVLIGTGLILLVPLVAMQFNPNVNWSLSDFIVVGSLLIGTGLLYDFLVKRLGKKNKVIIGVVLVVLLLWVWVELAVGLFTNWGS